MRRTPGNDASIEFNELRDILYGNVIVDGEEESAGVEIRQKRNGRRRLVFEFFCRIN